MVKRRELTENERVRIKALHDAGWSLRQIGTGGLINLLSTVYVTYLTSMDSCFHQYDVFSDKNNSISVFLSRLHVGFVLMQSVQLSPMGQ